MGFHEGAVEVAGVAPLEGEVAEISGGISLVRGVGVVLGVLDGVANGLG